MLFRNSNILNDSQEVDETLTHYKNKYIPVNNCEQEQIFYLNTQLTNSQKKIDDLSLKLKNIEENTGNNKSTNIIT